MRKYLLVKTIFCLLVFASCKSGVTNEEVPQTSFDGVPDSELVTPYSDMSLLENTRSASVSDPDIVNWKVARFFAIVKKIEFERHYSNWIGAKISEKPIIIYYSNQDKPKFYEFRVIKDGKEVGSITCNASKKEGQPVSYVSEMTHKVTAKVARELISNAGAVKLSGANYPSQFVMQEANADVRNASGEAVTFKDALTCEKLSGDNVFMEERFDKILEDADSEMLKKFEITEADKLKILEEMREKEEIEAEMWQAIDSVEDKIIVMSDEEIETKMHMTVEEFNSTMGNIGTKGIEWTENSGIDSQYYLTKWIKKKKWHIPRATWCGPAALTFVTLGMQEDSGCNFVPISNNDKPTPQELEKVGKLYDAFEEATGTGPAYLIRLNRGLQNMTNKRFWVQPIAFHRWQSSHDHLVNYGLPVLSLRYGSSQHGPAMHYRTIVGDSVYWYKNHYVRWWWFFGWWAQRWTQIDYNYWYYMRDNYADSKLVQGTNCAISGSIIDFWEITGRSFHSQLFLIKRW